MKKRLIIGVSVFLIFLLGGVVYAANPIRIIVNGRHISSDVAPTIISGRTMVPIRFVAEALGANVEWEQSTKTVNITTNNKEIATLKYYSTIAEQYRRLEVLGEMLSDLSRGLSLVFNGIELNNDISYLNTVNTRASNVINLYNEDITLVNDMILAAKNNGIDISDMNLILTDYDDAIDYYKEASDALYDYYLSNSEQDFDRYLKNSEKLFNSASLGRSKAIQGYFKYYDMIQDY